jgi:undecaprenyl-diphosphatase
MFRALVLGAVQGLTEFVPVSSSAHLVLVPFLLGWPIPGLPFDVAVHLGTALALLLYFFGDFAAIVAGSFRAIVRRGSERDTEMGRVALLLVAASIPAAVAGLFFSDFFERLYQQPVAVAFQLLVTAALLLAGEAIYRRRRQEDRRGFRGVSFGDAALIGVLQAAAIIPGISRSAATITGGMALGLSREAAARFSFLLAFPALLGAGLLEVPDLPSSADLGTVLAATAVAAVIGFASIAFLLRYLRTHDTRPFAYYCVLFCAGALTYAAFVD